MTPNESKPINERVTILEVQLSELKGAVRTMVDKEGRIETALNAISINLATLTQKVSDIIAERSIWKNPLVWTNLLSLGVALYALLK